MTTSDASFILGWEEWLSLPGLGLPAVKAKVDTGARTSALHAFQIEMFGSVSAPMVRFGVHPVPGRESIEVFCSAPVVDRREVTSSNGEREMRLVIATPVRIGAREWPIEVTLTNRESMSYRMLLGRQAIREDMFVDPATSFRQRRLSYKLYRHMPRQAPVLRALRIALLTRKPQGASSTLIAEAARARGHVIEALDPDRLELTFCGAEAGISHRGGRLGHYDAVLLRSTRIRQHGDASLVRQFEVMGSYALNGGDALERASGCVAPRQALAREGIHSEPLAPGLVSDKGGAIDRVLVVDGRRVVSVVRKRAARGERSASDGVCALAERAAKALRLGLCAIDIARRTDDASEPGAVVALTATPSLRDFAKPTGVNGADAIMAALESRARSWVRRQPASGHPTEGAESEPR